MSYDYKKLWQPIKINNMRLRNRIMLSAMGTFTPMQDGTDSEEGIRYYEERAKGGVGLIMTGAMFLNEKTAQGGPTLALHSTRAIPKATVMTERIHRWGAKACLQLSCGTGRNGMPDIGERVPISSSANPSFYNPEMICRPLETEEIKEIMKDFANAAQFAVNAGFDAVEVHGHAGYLIDQFISPQWNSRTDEYGGSWENRVRFATEIVDSIRSVTGPDFRSSFAYPWTICTRADVPLKIRCRLSNCWNRQAWMPWILILAVTRRWIISSRPAILGRRVWPMSARRQGSI